MKESFEELVKSLHALRDFLASAPAQFGPNDRIRRHELPNSEVVSCIKWDEGFFISGTDILRCIVYRFQAFGRDVLNRAKFEEFVFSDLRSLKTNVRARLEEGKSELLEFLHNYGCIRTKKKQRVFYWDAVPHDQLFLDSLERELRRAVIDDANNESHRITVAIREPALSMKYDPLLKVAHQIDNIIRGTPLQYVCVMRAVLGVPHQNPNMFHHHEHGPISTIGRVVSPVASDIHRHIPSLVPGSVLSNTSHSVASYARKAYDHQHRFLYGGSPDPLATPPTIPADRLPPPQMHSAPENRDVQLPSIKEALPPHAHFDPFPPSEDPDDQMRD